jgi:hypothetical protein
VSGSQFCDEDHTERCKFAADLVEGAAPEGVGRLLDFVCEAAGHSDDGGTVAKLLAGPWISGLPGRIVKAEV